MIPARLSEAQVALMLLTRLPAGRIHGQAPSIGASGWAFPLCGAIVGALAWLAYALAVACGLPPSIAAIIAVAAGIVLTGGLHEDGLADLADGLGGGRDRPAKLAIMRDSRIGSYGALALILALLLRVVAVGEVGQAGPLLAALVGVGAASRGAMLLAMQALPPARADGLGRGASGLRTPLLAAGLALAAILLIPLGSAALAVMAVVAFAAAATSLLAARQLGGQTGDVLGAVQVIAEVAGWLAIVALLG